MKINLISTLEEHIFSLGYTYNMIKIKWDGKYVAELGLSYSADREYKVMQM